MLKEVFRIRVASLEKLLLSFIIISLLVLSDDGILPYGSIPTYLILFIVVLNVGRAGINFKFPKFEIPFFGFGVCILLSIVIGFETVSFPYISSFVLMLLTYFGLRSYPIHQGQSELYSKLFSLFLLLNSVFLFLQLVTANPIFFFSNLEYQVPTGLSSEPHKNALAILIAYSFLQTRCFHQGKQLACIALVAVCLSTLVISASRAGLLTFALISFYIFFTTPCPRYFRIRALVTFSGLVLPLGLVQWSGFVEAISFLLHDDLLIAFQSATQKLKYFFSDDSVGERISTWSVFLEMESFNLARLLTFGFGPGSFNAIFGKGVHNLPLDVLSSTGLVGLCFLLVFFVSILCRKLHNDEHFCGASLKVVVIAILIFSCFHDFGRARYLWVFLGLVAAYHCRLTGSYKLRN